MGDKRDGQTTKEARVSYSRDDQNLGIPRISGLVMGRLPGPGRAGSGLVKMRLAGACRAETVEKGKSRAVKL